MGCLFSCFRLHDKHHLPKTNDVVVSRNPLSTLFLTDSKEDGGEDNVHHNGNGSQRDCMQRKDVAKFLKACSTIESTPDEIRKASEKLKVSPSCNTDSGPPKFHSWLPDTSAQNVPIAVQPFNPPTPKIQCEEWEKRTDCSEHTPSSCISNANNTPLDYHDSTEGSGRGSCHPTNETEMNNGRNKSVRFECDTDISSCESFNYGGWHMTKTESPNPTPMKLSEEMQTPGTVYSVAFEDMPNGMPRVKSQFVYPSNSLGEDASKSKILKEEDNIPVPDSIELSQNATSTPDNGLNKNYFENESKVEESLSSWLKPASVILEERSKKMEMGYNHVRKTPADRPIIGMVAVHWNEDLNSDLSPPKWWDGNGIPNSTNKYKEDQKVSWHATPFEERLEKALSEDTVISKRKDICGKPIAFEENDTALSQMKSSTHSQSVVSF